MLDERLLGRHRPNAVLALALGSAATLALAEPATAAQQTASGTVALVQVLGPLAQRTAFDLNLCGYLEGYDSITARVSAAMRDPGVDAVVLEADSPGGDLAGLEEAVRRIREERAATGKVLLVHVNELAASAMVWLSLAADGIYGAPAARFGSIGVLAVHVDTSGAHEKAGLAVTIVRAPANKANPNALEPLDKVGRDRLQRMVGEAMDRFVAAVAEARDVEASSVRALDAEVLTMKEAVKRGLADGVESLEATITRAAKMARKRKKDMNYSAELAALAGLPATATDDEIDAALPQLRRRVAFAGNLLGLAATADTEAATGTIAAWKGSHAALPEARAKAEQAEAALKDQTAAEETAERSKLLGAVARALGPAVAYENPHEPLAQRRPAKGYAEMSLGALRAHVDTLAPLPPAMGGEKKPASGNATGLNLAALPPAARAELERLAPEDRAAYVQTYQEMWGGGRSEPREEQATWAR